MPDDSKGKRRKVVESAAAIYANGYAEGMSQVAAKYDLQDILPRAGAGLPEPLTVRMSLVDEAVGKYIERVKSKQVELMAEGIRGPELEVELTSFARELAENKSDLIAEMEFSQARLDGAGRIMDEAEIPHEWRFAHFDLGGAHEECNICQAIREGAPYNTEEAEAEGFPSMPHPNCDHGWVLVPEGERSKSEEFPVDENWPRFTGGKQPDVKMARGVRVLGDKVEDAVSALRARPKLRSNPHPRGEGAGPVVASSFRFKGHRGFVLDPQAIRQYGVEQDVKLADLEATQPAVRVEVVSNYIRTKGGGVTDASLPVVIDKDGTLYIGDGHHRLEASRMLGARSAKVLVVKLDSDGQAVSA